jgi:hypothetical protein
VPDLMACLEVGDQASVMPALSDRRHAHRWDPPESGDPEVTPSDYGWIGEDRDGVWLAEHPDLAMSRAPELWAPMLLWQAGVESVGIDGVDSLSMIEVQGLAILRRAAYRASRRSERDGSSS